jgi:hypothetical protein
VKLEATGDVGFVVQLPAAAIGNLTDVFLFQY